MSTAAKRTTLLLASIVIFSMLIAACGASGGSAKPVEVKVTLTEFKYETSLTTFTVGTPYRFVVTNAGSVAHELLVMAPGGKEDDALFKIAETDLQPGATKTVEYTFKAPAAEGTLEMACYIPGHYEAGMHTPIVVK